MTRANSSPARATDRVAALVLWLLPVAFTLLLFAARGASLPFWQAFNLDPDYYYLLNGLRIVEGLAPTDVSHPGTPIQVLVALVIRALHPFAPTGQVVDAVLADPEGHLMAATTVIYGLVGLALWRLGRAAYAWGGLWPALLAQSSPFLSAIILKMALHPKPEPFLVIAVCGLMAAAFAAARPQGARDRDAIWAGVAMGFGIACKLHFVALGVLPLLLLDRRRFVLYAVTTTAAFLVFVAPALPSLDIWLGWIHRMAVGSGAYGEGAQTIIDPARYPHQVLRLFSARWFFTGGFIGSLLMLAAYFRLRRRALLPADPGARLLAGIVLAQIATVLLVAKQPAPHYMIPAMLLAGPALAVLWAMSGRILPVRAHTRFWGVLAVAAVVASGSSAWRQIRELSGWSHATQALPMERFASCAKVYFDAASAKSFAFQRGDMNALARYSPKLAAIFPTDEYSWFIFDHTWWRHGLVQWARPVELTSILEHYPCVVFRGNQDGRFQAVSQGITFDDVCKVGEETLFAKGITCAGERR